MPRDLTPEDRLCLLLARGNFSADVEKCAKDRLEAGPQWGTVLGRAQTHGLLPLVYHRLRALNFPSVPQSVQRQLRDFFGVNALRNELLAQELVRVLTRLDAANLPAIPLKGLALAESLYGDPALRSSADLDILIPPERFPECL